jgi:hypothetical protein
MVLHTRSDPIQFKQILIMASQLPPPIVNSQYANTQTKRITKATHGPPAPKKTIKQLRKVKKAP